MLYLVLRVALQRLKLGLSLSGGLARLLHLLEKGAVLDVQALAHLGFGLDDALQFGDVLVQKFLLLFGA